MPSSSISDPNLEIDKRETVPLYCCKKMHEVEVWRTMRIEHMRFFLTVADAGSISRAANDLFISQQTLSAIIRKLEEDVGTPLLIRHHNGVSLTEAGKNYYECAKQITALYGDFLKRVQHPDAGLSGKLEIYILPMMEAQAGEILARFSADHPHVVIDARNSSYEEILDTFKNYPDEKVNRAALIVIPPLEMESFLKQNQELDFTPLKQNRFSAAVKNTSPLASRESISFEELLRYPIISYEAPIGISRYMQALIRRHGRPNIAFASGNVSLCLQAASRGQAVFLVPDDSGDNPLFQSVFSTLARVPIEGDMGFTMGCLLYAGEKNRPLQGGFLRSAMDFFGLIS